MLLQAADTDQNQVCGDDVSNAKVMAKRSSVLRKVYKYLSV